MTVARQAAADSLLSTMRAALPQGDPVAARFEQLVRIIEGLGSCVLALSGGIDSSFLLAVASDLLGPRCLAVTGDSLAVPAWDRANARLAGAAAEVSGASWRVVATHELDDPRYAQNPRSRCYYCKTEVYGTLEAIARTEGYAAVVDGTNATDALATDRPGIAAGEALGVRSPLAEAGITKHDVRVLARALGLKDWDRPSSACLSSRIPYGARITPERLRRVEVAELEIRALGYLQVRVRDLGARARVEVEAADMERLLAQSQSVDSALQLAGFGSWSAAVYAGTGAGDVGDSGR